jgi:hypothetical protein
MLHAYEGYLEKGRFYPIGPPINVQGRCRVIVTVLDEPTPEQKETSQAQAWREFFETVNASSEEIPETYERVNFTREVDL